MKKLAAMWLSYLVGLGVSIESATYPALETVVGVRQESGAGASLHARVSQTTASAADNAITDAWYSDVSLKTLDLGIGLDGATGPWLFQAWGGVHLAWGTQHDFDATTAQPTKILVDRTVHTSSSNPMLAVLVARDVSTVFDQRVSVFAAGEIAAGDRGNGTMFSVDEMYAALTLGIAVRR